MRRTHQSKALALLLTLCLLTAMFAGCNTETTTPDPTPGDPATPGTDPVPGDPAADKPEEITDWVFSMTLSQELETFNILYSQQSVELTILSNCIDGLLTNDTKGNLVANVADTWGTEDGGLNWTFHIRDGVQWVDYQGNVMAEATAEDWLYGLEWVLNFWKNDAANTSMPIEMIEGAGDYYLYTKGLNDESTDEDKAAFEAVCTKYGLPATPLTEDEAKALDLTVFKQVVGCEAPDKNTLIYRCVAALPYFDTVATYGCLYPACGALIEKLGVEGFKACSYDNMWYTGPYTITTYVQGNEKVLTKNPNYWNKDVKLFNTVTCKMVESNDIAFQLYTTGELHTVNLTESNLQTISKSPSNEFHDYLCEARPVARSYQFHLIYDKLFSDGTPDTNWNLAVANEAFRQSWYYGLDLTSYFRRTNSINPLKCANYGYTVSNLCFLSDGTEYSQLVRDKIGLQLPAVDGAYNRADADKAAQYKRQAMTELAAKGVTFPIQVDYYVQGSNQAAIDTATVLKQIFSDCLGDDYCVLNINTYVSSLSKEVLTPQLDSFHIAGWGADYGDPKNYLGQETYGEDNAYYSVAISKINKATDPDLIATYQEFTDMVNAANAIVTDMDARYEAFAEAEAFMLQHALVIPCYINVAWELTHVNDYSKIDSPYGAQKYRFINWETSVDGYTTEDYDAFMAAYNAN